MAVWPCTQRLGRIGWAVVSSGSSLFFYFPISLLLPWAAKSMISQNKKRLLYLFVFIIILNWLHAGTSNFQPNQIWWGEGWGPRYFVVLLPFITLMVGSLLVGIKKKTVLRDQWSPCLSPGSASRCWGPLSGPITIRYTCTRTKESHLTRYGTH